MKKILYLAICAGFMAVPSIAQDNKKTTDKKTTQSDANKKNDDGDDDIMTSPGQGKKVSAKNIKADESKEKMISRDIKKDEQKASGKDAKKDTEKKK